MIPSSIIGPAEIKRSYSARDIFKNHFEQFFYLDLKLIQLLYFFVISKHEIPAILWLPLIQQLSKVL